MIKIHKINSSYLETIVKNNLCDEETIFNWSNGQYASKRRHGDSSVLRCEIDGLGAVYFKRYTREKKLAFLKGSYAKREFKSSKLMTKAGLAQPEIILVATRYSKGVPTGSVLITKEIPDATDLREIIDSKTDGTNNSLKDLALALKNEIEKMHKSGFCHWDLKPRNILVMLNSDKYKFIFIDSRNGRIIRPWDRVFCKRRDKRFLICEEFKS